MRAYFPNDDRWQMNDRDTSSQLEPILRVAAANNIVVYGISSSGLGLAGGANSAYQASSGGGISRQGVGQIILPELSRQASQASFESGATLAALARSGALNVHRAEAAIAELGFSQDKPDPARQ